MYNLIMEYYQVYTKPIEDMYRTLSTFHKL